MKSLSFTCLFLLVSNAAAQTTTLQGPTDTVTIVNHMTSRINQFEIGRFDESHKLPEGCPFPRYASQCLSNLTRGYFETYHGYPISYGEPIQVTYDNKFLNLGIFVRIDRRHIFEITDCAGAMNQHKRYYSSRERVITINIHDYDGVCLRHDYMVITLTDKKPEIETPATVNTYPPRNGI